jgi:hypothetical protein
LKKCCLVEDLQFAVTNTIQYGRTMNAIVLFACTLFPSLFFQYIYTLLWVQSNNRIKQASCYLWWNRETIKCTYKEEKYTKTNIVNCLFWALWKHKTATVSYNVVFGFGPIKALNSNHGQVWRHKDKYTQRVLPHPLQHTC